MWKLVIVLAAALLLAPFTSWAQNTPCSGHKGGINHCQGNTFVCNDGSVSGSKKSCPAYTGGLGMAAGLMGSGSTEMAPTETGDCSCDSGKYCTGPRGGRYCMTHEGTKSYMRHD
ncbi:hypothetical protein RsS62_63830 [Rhizobium dioscoreae]|uniref:hypothetical protein n=1 Tax=Rhizobium TaxID=379 RepID=UPI001260A238|nr:hypothetical protein [Rhizobium dioscoreae]GES47131.1 hypothetical protein RsS62_63830 [Rhizobium dioscoreae]